MHHIRFFLVGDEVAFTVFGQAGLHSGQDLVGLALGVKLLQLRLQAGALGRGGGEGDATKAGDLLPRNRLYLMSSLAKYSSREIY